MILNLSDVLSEQHKAIHESVPIEMTCFKSEMGRLCNYREDTT